MGVDKTIEISPPDELSMWVLEAGAGAGAGEAERFEVSIRASGCRGNCSYEVVSQTWEFFLPDFSSTLHPPSYPTLLSTFRPTDTCDELQCGQEHGRPQHTFDDEGGE